MYKVTVVAVNETIEVEVKAKYCIVDSSNNLIFTNKVEITDPVGVFPAGRWVFVLKQ